MAYRTHGLSKHPLYPTWHGMIRRCENPADPGYKNYGGRGIAVCERWHDVRLFIADIESEIGPRPPGLTLDRTDNEGSYGPGKVQWATHQEQQHNRRMHVRGPFMKVPPRRPEGERWLPAPDYVGWYEISDAGNVFSLSRAATWGGLLDRQVNSRGYLVVLLSKYGKVRTVPVARLVLGAFRGPANGRRARFGPGGPADVSLANLEWWP